MSFTSFIIAVLITYLRYVLFGAWKDLNEALHSDQLSSDKCRAPGSTAASPGSCG